ncbi:MAG: hypothetical protein K2G22_00585, partial [Eubacterium sp.]|nr:hypothetical protein [Eubacterium sp.]
MGKPKRFKKLLSFFLAFLMLLSSLTVGFTAFAANEHPDNEFFKDAVTDIKHPSNDVTSDTANYLDAIAKGFAYGAPRNSANYQAANNDAAKALGAKINSSGGWSRGTWLVDDANGTMYAATEALWGIVFNACLTLNQKTSGTDPGLSNILNQVNTYLKAKMGGYWFNSIQEAAPYYMAAMMGVGNGSASSTSNWPSSNGNSTNVFVQLNEEYYLWNSYGNDLDKLTAVVPTIYSYWWKINISGVFSKTSYIDDYIFQNPIDFILVNADELKDFKKVFIADDGSNCWNDFNNRNFANISTDMQLKLVEELESKYNAIKNVNTAQQDWKRDSHDTQGTYNLTTDAAATEKIFNHYFTTYTDFNADLQAFYMYMVQQYIDAVNAIKDSLYESNGQEKNITDRDELVKIKVLIENAQQVYNNLPDSIKNNASVKATLTDASNRYNTYNIRFVSLWNTMVGNAYVEAGKALEPYAPEDYVISSDAEAKSVKKLLDSAEDLFDDFLPAGTSYKDITKSPYSITDSNLTIDKMTQAETTYTAAKKTYDEYMYRRFLEIAREQFADYYTTEPLWTTIQIPTNLNIFNILPIRSKVSKVLNAYNEINDSYKQTANSAFFYEIARRLNAAIEPITSNEKFEKNDSLYKLVYPMKDVQVDKNTTLSTDDVNTLIANLDTFLVSKTFRDALLDGYTADQFLDIFLQGYYVDSQGVKHYGVNEDGTTKTEGLLTGKSGNNIANMLMSMVLPMVQDALKGVDLSTLDVGVSLSGSAYDLQCGNAKATVGITVALTPVGFILCGDPDDVYQYNLIKANSGFYNAALQMAGSGQNWDYVNWDLIDWQIDDTNEFFEWVGAFLSLIDRIAAAIFFDYTYGYQVKALSGVVNQRVALESTFKPSNGYPNAILPFLTILGVDTSGIDTQTLRDLSFEDNGVRWDTIVQRLGSKIISWAKDLLTDKPVSKIIEILPSLGYMLLYDKITQGVDTITYTLTELGIKWRSLAGMPDTFKVDADFVTGILEGLMGEDSKFQLPSLDWAKLSYLGDYTYITLPDKVKDENGNDTNEYKKQKYIDAYAPDVLVYIVYYLASVVSENGDFIKDLAGEEEFDPETGTIKTSPIRDLLANVVDTASKTDQYGNAREFGSAIFKLIRTYSASDYDWSNFSWKQSLVDFAQITLFTKAEVVELIDTLSEIIGNLIPKLLTDKETGTEKTIDDVLNELVYKSSLVDSLFNGIYGTFGSDLMQTILKFVEIKDANYSVTKQTLSIDTSIATIRTRLQEAGFAAVAQKLAGKDSYTGEGFNVFDDIHCGEKIDPKDENSASYNDDWGISNANQFKAALKAILSPFNDLIGVLLAGGNGTVDKGTRGYISVANAVTVVGANGYANSLKALLDSIGCPTMSASDFSRQPSAALSNLIDMIFATVNLYCDDPLNSILSAIPGLAAFIDNKGLQTAISQIISPLNNVIGAVCDLAQIDNTDPKNHNVLDHQGIFRWVANDLVPWILDIETEDGVEWANLQNEIFELISSKIPDIKLDAKDENGNKIQAVDKDGNPAVDENGNPVYEKVSFPLTIPQLDWADIAGSGTQDASEKTLITGDNPSTLVKLVRFIWEDVVVGSNKDSIEGILINLLGSETYTAIIDNINFFDWSGDKVLAIIIKIFKGLDSSAYKGEVNPFEDGITLNTIVDMIAGTAVGQITPSTIVYPTNPSTGAAYGSSNVKDFVNVLTNIAMSLLENYADFDLSTLAKDGVYTSDLVASVAKVIYPLFDNATVASVFDMIGVNVFNVNKLGGLLKLYDYNDVSMIVELPITEGEGLTSADYPGETSRGSSNWIYTAQLDANGKE